LDFDLGGFKNIVVKDFLKKYWFWIALLVVVIVIGIIVYYKIFNAGKQQGTSTVLATIPNPTNDAPYTTQESQAIRTYTTWLDGEFHWYTIHNDTQWSALSLEKDRILIGVSNQYALDYNTPGVATSGTGNLYNDIQSTYFLTTSDATTVATRLKALLGL
jgi:hypothetical protein